ncbi:MAG: class I SAM-dependent methyltransferase [Rhodospirillales bacterium]
MDAQKAPATAGSRRLNLGCGRFPKPGYVNVDVDDRGAQDITHDLNRFPYPFADGAFDLVESSHSLEHLADPFAVMAEIHRLLAPGGKAVIKVPHFSRGLTHPDHKRGFDVSFPYYFDPDFPGGYSGTPFELVSLRLRWNGQPYLKKQVFSWPIHTGLAAVGVVVDLFANLSPALCSRIWCFWVGGFEEIEFAFRKPGAGG